MSSACPGESRDAWGTVSKATELFRIGGAEPHPASTSDSAVAKEIRQRWATMLKPTRSQPGSVPFGINPSTKSSTNNPKQPCLWHGIGIDHQGQPRPSQCGGRCFSPSPISDVANDSKQDGANNVRRAGQNQAKGFEILQFIHASW